MNEIKAIDLSEYGAMERQVIEELLSLYNNDKLTRRANDALGGDGPVLCFNEASCQGFITTSEYAPVLVPISMNGNDMLGLHIACPECSNEWQEGMSLGEIESNDMPDCEECQEIKNILFETQKVAAQ